MGNVLENNYLENHQGFTGEKSYHISFLHCLVTVCIFQSHACLWNIPIIFLLSQARRLVLYMCCRLDFLKSLN